MTTEKTVSFFDSMHPDEKVRASLYEMGTVFMGGEVAETFDIHEVHCLLKKVAADLDGYRSTGDLKAGPIEL